MRGEIAKLCVLAVRNVNPQALHQQVSSLRTQGPITTGIGGAKAVDHCVEP